MPRDADFLEAAKAACVSWDLDPIEIGILSHTENVVCRIKLSATKQVVMRLHRPGYNDLAELNSEVQWVHSLAHAGLPVPTARVGTSFFERVDLHGCLERLVTLTFCSAGDEA